MTYRNKAKAQRRALRGWAQQPRKCWGKFRCLVESRQSIHGATRVGIYQLPPPRPKRGWVNASKRRAR